MCGKGVINMKVFREFYEDESGITVIEIVLVLVGICIADKSRILCGNFRCI